MSVDPEQRPWYAEYPPHLSTVLTANVPVTRRYYEIKDDDYYHYKQPVAMPPASSLRIPRRGTNGGLELQRNTPSKERDHWLNSRERFGMEAGRHMSGPKNY